METWRLKHDPRRDRSGDSFRNLLGRDVGGCEEAVMVAETMFYFFLVIGPVPPGPQTKATFHDFPTRQACWQAHAQALSGKDEQWLLTHFVTSCSPHPAVTVPEK